MIYPSYLSSMAFKILLLCIHILIQSICFTQSSDVTVLKYNKIETDVVSAFGSLNCKMSQITENLGFGLCYHNLKVRSGFLVGQNETACIVCFNDDTVPLIDVSTLKVNWLARQGRYTY